MGLGHPHIARMKTSECPTELDREIAESGIIVLIDKLTMGLRLTAEQWCGYSQLQIVQWSNLSVIIGNVDPMPVFLLLNFNDQHNPCSPIGVFLATRKS